MYKISTRYLPKLGEYVHGAWLLILLLLVFWVIIKYVFVFMYSYYLYGYWVSEILLVCHVYTVPDLR